MKTYMKFTYLFLVSLLGLTACQEEPFTPVDLVPEGYVAVEFVASVPQMSEVQTKAVDPDGAGVQQMTVFCFDENGLFLTTVNAEMTPTPGNPSLTGKMLLYVPEQTYILQLVGNQNLTYFREDNYRGMSEVDVMAALEASAGRMIYWARKTMDEIHGYNSTSNPVHLLRNQAKITLNVHSSVNFRTEGWVVVNSNAFGTVAPYNSDQGFVAPHYQTNPFVTLPLNTSKLTNYVDVHQVEEEYIFETENTADSPIDFILKGSLNGGPSLYYRISFLDVNREYLPVLRNHHYTVEINGPLYYGQTTFAAALEAPATNNVWVSISDDIKEITDGDRTLAVKETFVMIGENEFQTPTNLYYLHYTLKNDGSTPLTQAEVAWAEGNNVAKSRFTHTFDAATGEGLICIELNDMGGLAKREGNLMVKWGNLVRSIKVVTVKEQNFEPAWITTNVYGTGTGEHITMMFTIPEDCPAELFPMEVLVSVNDIDVRSESGMALPIITPEDPRYGADNGIGYKYLLRVDGVGKQRLYLETIQNHLDADHVDLTIEARYFRPLTKVATFREDTDYSIILDNLYNYSVEIPRDEVLFFYLVPQKVNAPVSIETHLAEGAIWNPVTQQYDYTAVDAHPNDEFLFYSTYLDHNEDPSMKHYFDFTEISSEDWSTGGRVHLFTRTSEMPTENHGAVFHLLTNAPKSAEVVRIASNPSSTGNQYRSAIFELANFHPFHFAAQVNGQGTLVSGEKEEAVDDIRFDYEPNQPVLIDLDITSFKSAIRKSEQALLPDAQQVSVDPFGTEFDIYIDAPMLKLDEDDAHVLEGRLFKDEQVPGRFIYRVKADREAERASGFASAALADDKAQDQSGERKRLAFLTQDIVSAGDIVISSDQTKVIFYEKKFRVQNNSLTGVLHYRRESDGAVLPVPAGSFVPFEVLPTYNRIGSISVEEGGHFELRLRSEYEYDWNTDDVKFQFVGEDGEVYEKTFGSLSYLNGALGGPIILE